MVKEVRWRVYIARCVDDTLYTGISIDVDRRCRAHNAGRGAVAQLVVCVDTAFGRLEVQKDGPQCAVVLFCFIAVERMIEMNV